MKTAYKTFPTSTTATDPTTLQSFTSYYDIFTVGAGYLDIAAALAIPIWLPQRRGSAVSQAPSMTRYRHRVDRERKLCGLGATSVVWGSSVVWGNSGVWGSNVAESPWSGAPRWSGQFRS